MKRRLIIDIYTGEDAEKTGFSELLENIQDFAENEIKTLIKDDSIEHNYPYDQCECRLKKDNQVLVDSHWELTDEQKKEKQFTVWTGGTEVVDYYVDYEQALKIARNYVAEDYNDVSIQSKDQTYYEELHKG